ncbi:MAG: hypothetical protein ABEL51_11460 [Salinibacter sp.]
MLQRSGALSDRIDAARDEGNDRRARRLFRLYIKNQRLQTREAGRIRRALTAVIGA